MKKRFLFFLLIFWIAGCSPQPPSEATDFPLEKGTTWTYSYKAYEPSPTDPAQVIEANYQMVETVIDTENISDYFIAHVKKEYQLINMDPGWSGDFEVSQPNEYWYITDDDKMFESRSPMDTNTIDTRDFVLEYDFPLSLSDAWCLLPLDSTKPNSGKEISCEFVGKRMVTNTGDFESPAGAFDNCYELTDYFNGGNLIHWLCSGVGIVFMKFDHMGTRFGFEQTLMSYSKGKP
jgi:hypothetical protein